MTNTHFPICLSKPSQDPIIKCICKISWTRPWYGFHTQKWVLVFQTMPIKGFKSNYLRKIDVNKHSNIVELTLTFTKSRKRWYTTKALMYGNNLTRKWCEELVEHQIWFQKNNWTWNPLIHTMSKRCQVNQAHFFKALKLALPVSWRVGAVKYQKKLKMNLKEWKRVLKKCCNTLFYCCLLFFFKM